MGTLAEVAKVFGLLGISAFGGPAAHTAMMHEQVVVRRRWVTDAEFTDLLAAVNLIPGPNSTELAIHIGRRVAGWRGFAVAGACFITPSAVIVSVLAALYVRYGSTPDARAALAGVTPVIIAVIAHATVQLAGATLKSAAAWVVAAASLVMSLAGVNELAVLGIAAVAALALSSVRSAAASAIFVLGAAVPVGAAGASLTSVSLVKLSLFFLKVGSVLFGSGYVLLAFLRGDLVERWGWLTEQQLVDAIAVGQFTPGPLSTTATFIGYLLAGWAGAVLSTCAIFLPAFVFVALTHAVIPRLRRSRVMASLLDGVVAASLALMAAVAMTLARVTLTSPIWGAVSLAAFVALARWRVNSAWLVLVGALVGVAVSWGTSAV